VLKESAPFHIGCVVETHEGLKGGVPFTTLGAVAGLAPLYLTHGGLAVVDREDFWKLPCLLDSLDRRDDDASISQEELRRVGSAGVVQVPANSSVNMPCYNGYDKIHTHEESSVNINKPC
jgi:hypothetical protein